MRRLAYKFELDRSQHKSSQANASVAKRNSNWTQVENLRRLASPFGLGFIRIVNTHRKSIDKLCICLSVELKPVQAKWLVRRGKNFDLIFNTLHVTGFMSHNGLPRAIFSVFVPFVITCFAVWICFREVARSR